MVKREILDALNREPYKAAFQNVNYKMLSGEQSIFVFFSKTSQNSSRPDSGEGQKKDKEDRVRWKSRKR